jgi:hypothetical protein
MENVEEVDINVKGVIDLVKFDIEPYLGKKTDIQSAKTYEGKHGYFVKVETKSLGKWTNNDGEEKEVKASRIFSLHQDKDKNIGWGEDTKLGLFMKKMEATELKDLVGKKVITQSVTKKEGDFLSFN